MYEWLFLYVPLRYLCIFKHVLPETEDAWQDMFLYLGRHRSRYISTASEDQLFKILQYVY